MQIDLEDALTGICESFLWTLSQEQREMLQERDFRSDARHRRVHEELRQSKVTGHSERFLRICQKVRHVKRDDSMTIQMAGTTQLTFGRLLKNQS
jgi:hypothetical protein